MQKQQLFERQEPGTAIVRWQANEAIHLMRDGQQCLQNAAVCCAFQLQREAVSGVGDEREGMCRINGQWRENRKDLPQEHIIQKTPV